MGTEKTTGTNESKTETTGIEVGGINKMTKEGAEFFYGASITMGTSKTGTSKTEETKMPVIIGVEADAASWLTLRGSITQNVLIGSTKTTGSEADTIAPNTKVAAGAGFKFNKAVLDVVLNAGTSGALDANLGANAGLTYMF
jgi:hypothetical protein